MSADDVRWFAIGLPQPEGQGAGGRLDGASRMEAMPTRGLAGRCQLSPKSRVSRQAPAELRRDSGGAFTLPDGRSASTTIARRVNSEPVFAGGPCPVSRLVSITKCARGPAR